MNKRRLLMSAFAAVFLSTPTGCGTMADAMVPAPSCVAYPTEPNALQCGEERLFLCTTKRSCEARFIDQLRELEAPADLVLQQTPLGTDGVFERDQAALGDNVAVTRWRALAPASEGASPTVIARLDVATPQTPVQGWAAAACFATGERAESDRYCRKTLASFSRGELFPVQTMLDAVAPPTTAAHAPELPRIGSRGIFFDPNVCRVVTKEDGGMVECAKEHLEWRFVANTHAASAAANSLMAAFTSRANVVRRRTLPCSIDAVPSSCLVFDARMEEAPAGHITAFARSKDQAVAVACSWTGTDTLRPSPLCAAFFAPEGLAELPSQSALSGAQ